MNEFCTRWGCIGIPYGSGKRLGIMSQQEWGVQSVSSNQAPLEKIILRMSQIEVSLVSGVLLFDLTEV